ncbi:hypothetical protein [Ochrobactrum sp. BTU1]|uniref:hypothetical protein n=1 Tax=Ochrobactrum sp. BTU1 TaxID=2840456 RepID=UPI001C05B517|nr:hypothetical protein KMS41_26055 [Ochrobactrum sp. BTU1]
MKSATIYERKNRLYFHACSQTTAGIWMLSAPVLTTEKGNIREGGRMVKDCLAASRQGIAHPSSFPNLFKPMLDLAGVKSYGTFVNSSKSVGITTDDGVSAILTPYRNDGPKHGYTPLAEMPAIPLASDEELGAAILAALENAE